MFKRLYFVAVTLFWVIMNLLLWRSEIAAHRSSGSPVSVHSVWERILTAPDDSSLQVLHRGKRIGYCRWQAAPLEPEATPPTTESPDVIEGQIRQVTGYAVNVEGSLLLGDDFERLRITVRLELDADGTWRTFEGRVASKPGTWELRASALAQAIEVRSERAGATWERRFTFREIANPTLWLGLIGPAGTLGNLAGLLPPEAARPLTPGSLALSWQARTHWHTIGHSRLRAYRLEAQVLDQYRAVITVSRVGEILRVELPDDLVLLNEALEPF
ncbi:MAG TPA: hypothetical protein PKM73_07900 [Verrucomicrobiota bacterium]|nr:hypothetical protein [Verrucomicrobiota bacterium]HNU51754.1 hypothetical protein [Verrucomicrobiota bacterium]